MREVAVLPGGLGDAPAAESHTPPPALSAVTPVWSGAHFRGPASRLRSSAECGGLRTHRSFSGGRTRHLDSLGTRVMFRKTCQGRGPYQQFPGLVVNSFLSNLKKITW